MKTVVPSREVYHLWANETQAEAYNSSRSVSFRDSMAFSYAAEIGRIIHRKRKGRAYLVSTRQWSITTSKHQSMLRSAIAQGEQVFHVYHIGAPAYTHVQGYMGNIATEALNAKRARLEWSRDCHTTRAAELIEEVKAYCRFFGLRVPKLDTGKLVADLQAARKRELARQAKQVAQARIDTAKRAAQWIAGDNVSGNFPDTLLRRDGDSVETSRGARVPFDSAKIAFVHWHNGTLERLARIGAYTVLSATRDGIKVGCHIITSDELYRFARSVGWIAILPMIKTA